MAKYHKFIRVAGVTFDSRQDIIDGIMEGDAVYLKPEPTNAYDPNACAVYLKERTLETQGDQIIGYVPRDQSSEVQAMMRQKDFTVQIDDITGGYDMGGKRASLGVVLILEDGYDEK